MTYQDILNELQKLTPEELTQTATIFDAEEDEFFEVRSFDVIDTDVLDPGHYVFSVY